MPIDTEYRQLIDQSIRDFPKHNLAESSINLFETLGYRSQKRLSLQPNTPEQFCIEFDAESELKEKSLLSDWKHVEFLFQLTDDEINASLGQKSLFTSKKVDNTVINSYLFFAIQLKNEQYTRSQLADITREVNKLFSMPVMILFQHGHNLTLSIIARRLNKRDASKKDVLEKVTVIKDISIANPHRAHVEILFDLSISELNTEFSFTNFVDLQRAWEKTLDTSKLNRKFYKEVADWYFWAVQNVHFPVGDNNDSEENRNAINIIRLITRLIFVWFLKEKKLVPENLFKESKIRQLLKFEDPNNSTYYKAILQNLFFATLNQEMNTEQKPDNRKFRIQSKQHGGRDGNRLVTNLYRYESYFNDPQSALNLFSTIPFLNGGLFECLDKEVEKDGQNVVIRIDGFSDEDKNPLSVPDELFFGTEKDVDLNSVYDTRNKHYQVRGLIHVLNRYKFTIEENTPITEEIALDPELLGKVFENLLASFNPETCSTARKQTGSYYTPREIVSYMVDESLTAYFENYLTSRIESQQLGFQALLATQPNLMGENQLALGVQQEINSRLRHLLSYNEESPLFSEKETVCLIEAIDSIKALDPACGSGAFPMGILHKLVFILSRIDPGNHRWKQKQIDKANEITDTTIRENVILDIEQTFAENELDYGRKLYLIENCIYGIDIQSIAVQISKLRFFISLVVDQKIDTHHENYGIRPLPNLETKFVAANTLVKIEKPKQLAFRNPEIDFLERELSEVRKKHFSARTPYTKRKCREDDTRIRTQISVLLKQDGFPRETTEKLAHWNPYEQNISADFFDSEWMFGITGGFDIVIGNPPYVGHKGGLKNLFNTLKKSELGIRFNNERMDIFYYFFHVAIDISKTNGVISFITTNYFATADSAIKLRKDLKNRTRIIGIVNFNELKIFESAMGQHNQITTLIKGYLPKQVCKITVTKRSESATKNVLEKILDSMDEKSMYHKKFNDELYEGEMLYISSVNASIINENDIEIILSKLKNESTKLGNLCNISQGIVTGLDKITQRHLIRTNLSEDNLGKGCFIINNVEHDNFISEDASAKNILKPWYKNSNIQRYFTNSINSEWLIYSTSDSLISQYRQIYSHLLKFESAIKSRNYDSGELSKAKKEGVWWALSSARREFDFSVPKIVSPQRSYSNTFGYNEIEWYASADVYFITQKSSRVSLKYVLALLNSKPYYLWLYFKGKRKGEMLELYLKPLSDIPIKVVPDSIQKSIIDKVDSLLSFQQDKNSDEILNIEDEINTMVYKMIGYSTDEIILIENTFKEISANLVSKL